MQIFFAALPKRLALLVPATLVFGLASQPAANAQAAKGPSAVAAARLKNRPPRNWIRHYLGDDRYKIAGGVWKVVSTETDKYYYPAWAPEMLRQPAGNVIGFDSAAAAEEAGYKASSYGSGDALYGLTPAEIAAAKRRVSGTGGGASQGTRITLSDGASTVLLPRGWKHTIVGKRISTQDGQIDYPLDLLSPDNGETSIGFTFYVIPGVNVEPFLKPEQEKWLRDQIEKSDPATASALSGSKITLGKLAGMSGLTILPGAGAKLPAGMSGIITIVGRKSKMYMMFAQLATTDKTYGVVVNSFQAK